MRRLHLLVFLIVVIAHPPAPAGADSFHVGLEQDVLPYATSGYYFGAWAGRGHLRGRVVTAHVHKPDFVVESGFTNNVITAYAAVADYFPREGWAGPWASTGLVYWNSSIQSDQELSTAHYDNVLVNGSAGYVWKFHGNFYVSPWAGFHVRVGGDTEVEVDGKTFEPPLFNPEASVKFGWYF